MKLAEFRDALAAAILVAIAIPNAEVRADFFSWETDSSGAFTDPNRWHGPNFPEHTRFPGASDDATIDRGPLTVTISGAQATRELVTGEPTLDISGQYTVSQLSAYGGPLTVTGGGELNVSLWLMGARAQIDGSTARIGTLQPLGAGQGPSELVVGQGAEVVSQALDRSRGALRVIVEGAGARWTHAAALPFIEIVMHSGGRVEVPSADGVYLNAEGAGAVLSAADLFTGYGRIAGGARVESGNGETSGGGNLTLDGGTWVVRDRFINKGGDLMIQNSGVLSAREVGAGEFSTLTVVEGAGSRMEVGDLLRHRGGIQLKSGGALTCAEAQLDAGGVYAETGGEFSVAGDVACNNGLNLFNGGILGASGVYLADGAGTSAGMNVVGSGSVAQIQGGFAVGQRGQGTLTVRDRGRVVSGAAGLGVFPGSRGEAFVSGVLSEWSTYAASGGGGLLVGGAGTGILQVSGGAVMRVDGAALSVVGREAGSDGAIRLRDFGSALELPGGLLVVGQAGLGTVELDASSRLQVDRVAIGRSARDNRVTVAGQDSVLGVPTEMVVGDGGHGVLQMRRGAQGVIRRLVVGRESREDNLVTLEHAETRLSGSDRIDVGELNGRGRLEMFDTAEARPSAGLSVGIYDGSDGSLLLDRNAFIVTPGDVIIGGGANSSARATIRGGGALDALDVLVFAKPSGSATLDITNGVSSMDVTRDLQVGFGRGPAGPTLMRAGGGSFVSVGEALTVGIGGRLEVGDARFKVGATGYPPSGILRIGAGGRLSGSGRVLGQVEIAAGGVVAPGSSPGTLTLEGGLTQQAASALEIEISGTSAGSGYDVLHVVGIARIGGGLAIHFTDGFAPRAGQQFEFLRADGGILGEFERVQITGVEPGFQYVLLPEGANGIRMVAQNDGIATTVPTLAIDLVAGSAVVSWAANGTWILETGETLSGAWREVTAEPVLRDGRYVVALPIAGRAAFYRLRP